MINYKTIQNGLLQGTYEIPYREAHKVFLTLYKNYKHKFLLESKDISHIYGRLSLIGVDSALKLSGKDDDFEITQLNKRGEHYLKNLTDEDLAICDSFTKSARKISGTIANSKETLEETKRSKKKNITQIIRIFLEKHKLDQKCLLGLYGAFSYDFIRLFEDLGDTLPENNTNDFNLFLYDTFVFFDHLKEKCEIVIFRENTQEIEEEIRKIERNLKRPAKKKPQYKISKPSFSLDRGDYEDLVRIARDYTKKGEFFEVVFSNILKTRFSGDPFALYLKYRDENPSPYLFYFDFEDEQLVGASPEMMVRCEHGVVNLRPISGTARRGVDPVEDHENMLALLSDEKERAELDMLIDLGRNDLSRVCEPGIKITDYRFVEKYSKVMHTVAHLSGKLRKGYTSLDSLIACLNAGTLTGAPKVAAMHTIEKYEKERRGYYGGTVGYLTFSGDMDTGIIIRTAHIRGDKLRFQVGATLLYDSKPANEYLETMNKASAFLKTFSNSLVS